MKRVREETVATELIAHRVNTSEELAKLPPEYGVELDLRDRGDKLFLRHDPFGDGESFEDYLRNYAHGDHDPEHQERAHRAPSA